jgi:hypothetical protein
MHFKQISNYLSVTLVLISFVLLYSCGIDERGKMVKEEEKKAEMDSLFKDATTIPVLKEDTAGSGNNP